MTVYLSTKTRKLLFKLTFRTLQKWPIQVPQIDSRREMMGKIELRGFRRE
jgi:hypothetical protein